MTFREIGAWLYARRYRIAREAAMWIVGAAVLIAIALVCDVTIGLPT